MDDEVDDRDDSKRRTRNLSEKKRRDQFNMLVTELSTLITSNNRKMDKSTVLKSTISFLKNHNEVTVRSRAHDVQENWKPAFLSNEEFTYLVLEALEGFVMVFSACGRIYYVSESVTSLLGYNAVDIVNKSIFDLTFEEDRHNLYNLLQRNANSVQQMPNSSNETEIIRFQIHLRRGMLDFREEVSYDLVQFYGHFRTIHEQGDEEHDMTMGYQDRDSRIIFACIGRLHTPQLIRDVSLVDSSRNEFTSRHSLEWKFLFLDHRAPPIIGYLPFEVLGTSGYDYYHFDDLEKVVSCHEALMQKGELTSCYYRFLTKGQQWIWLQSRFYITYHQWNAKPEFVVCTHRVVSYEDVAKTMKKEVVDQDADVSEAEANPNNSMKDTPSDEPVPPLSPSYKSEAACDTYANYYQPLSQNNLTGTSSPEKSPAVKSSPSYLSDRSFSQFSQNTLTVPLSPDLMLMSPSCLSDRSFSQLSQKSIVSSLPDRTPDCMQAANEAYENPFHFDFPPASVKSASISSTTGTVGTAPTAATGASYSRANTRYTGGSDTTSQSGESRSSYRNSERESHNPIEMPLAPQHGMGAQYLDPSAYGGGVPCPPGMMPVPAVLVTSDQAQMQEQLQRKHEELQQMIVRQQEELRQVKEQLLMARFGILQPLMNVPNPYSTSEEMQNQQRMSTQLAFSNSVPRAAIAGYPQHVPVPLQAIQAMPPHSTQPPHLTHAPQPPHPPHPPHAPHPSEQHQHMPQ